MPHGSREGSNLSCINEILPSVMFTPRRDRSVRSFQAPNFVDFPYTSADNFSFPPGPHTNKHAQPEPAAKAAVRRLGTSGRASSERFSGTPTLRKANPGPSRRARTGLACRSLPPLPPSPLQHPPLPPAPISHASSRRLSSPERIPRAPSRPSRI